MPALSGKGRAAHLQVVTPAPEWQSLHLHARDGLKLHVRHIGNRAATGLPVICLPGLSRNVEDFEVIGRAIAESSDTWVVALDSRGRGGSEYDPNWKNYELPVELDDLQSVIVALGIEAAIFFGTSRGGLLTALSGLVRPDVIKGSILNDIGPVIEARGLARIRGYVGKLPAPRDFDEGARLLRQIFGTHFTDMAPEAWLDFARRSWKEAGGRLEPRYDVNLMRPLADLDLETPIPELWAQFATLHHAPQMVIRGELSDILSAATAAEMARRHPDCRVHEVPYQGHAPLLEDQPTIEAVRAFIRHCGDVAGTT